jgi:hypothetical protein
MAKEQKKLTATQAQELLSEFKRTQPKSLCYCKHTGDGANSEHAGVIGHGPCTVPGCKCAKFTWAKWRPLYKKLIEKTRAAIGLNPAVV